MSKKTMTKKNAINYLKKRASKLPHSDTRATSEPNTFKIYNVTGERCQFKVGRKFITCWVEERNGVPVLASRGSDPLIILPNTANDVSIMVLDWQGDSK